MPQSQSKTASTRNEFWENEGGSIAVEHLAAMGITRHITETYSVGGYRYTSLADATAQARRMIK